MGRVIAITNQKGGVGKTTTAINLGAALALAGNQTLIVDCDPQSNTTGGLGLPKSATRRSLYHGLTQDIPLQDLCIAVSPDGLHLIPSEKNLVAVNLELSDETEREHVVRQRIQPLRDNFAYVLIDCPPALDLLTLNALVAADAVLIPVQCEYFALEGVSELMDTLVRIRRSLNPHLAIEGILLTMYDDRTNLAHQVQDDLRDFFGEQVFQTVIPRNVRLAEAPSYGKSIFAYDPECKGAQSYSDLAKEVMLHDQKGVGARA